MPRPAPENAEQILLSPVDADAGALFLLRRTFQPDGSGAIKYVQVIGHPDEIEAFAQGKRVMVTSAPASGKTKVVSLPRLIMQRMLGRPLEKNELVQPENGNGGDCRRSNLVLTSRSEVAQADRGAGWSSTGTKYVYPTEGGRFFANHNNVYLGVYDTTEIAAAAVQTYLTLIENGMPIDEAKRRIKGKSKMKNKVTIRE